MGPGTRSRYRDEPTRRTFLKRAPSAAAWLPARSWLTPRRGRVRASTDARGPRAGMDTGEAHRTRTCGTPPEQTDRAAPPRKVVEGGRGHDPDPVLDRGLRGRDPCREGAGRGRNAMEDHVVRGGASGPVLPRL